MMEFIISNWWIILLLISLFLIFLKYTKGNTKNYKELLNQGAIIIDVRSESEYKSGCIKNSINVPLKDLTYITDLLKGMDNAEKLSDLSKSFYKKAVDDGDGELFISELIKKN